MRLILALTVLLALTASVAAQPTSPHETAATAAYDRGDLTTALREFEAAYAETQRPDLLYVIGKLHVATGDCARAIDHFNRFLATGPGPKATEVARSEIAGCERILAGPGDPSDPGTSTSGGATSTPADPHSGTPSDRPRRDKLALVLIGGGVAIDLLALLVYHQARDAQCDTVCTNITYDEYQSKESRASKLRLTSIALAGAGTIALGLGLHRHLTHRRRTVDVALLPTSSGALFVLDGRF